MRLKSLVTVAWLLACFASCREPKRNIALQPLGEFPRYITDTVASAIENQYDITAHIMPAIPIPATYYNAEKGPRYSADSILRFLRRRLPDSIDRVIGLAQADIFTTKKDAIGNMRQPASKYANWGIFGLGERPGRSCVVSSARLGSESGLLFLARMVKVSLHEVGHTLGLPHCPDKQCVMTDAVEKLSTVDAAQSKLCESCRKRLM